MWTGSAGATLRKWTRSRGLGVVKKEEGDGPKERPVLLQSTSASSVTRCYKSQPRHEPLAQEKEKEMLPGEEERRRFLRAYGHISHVSLPYLALKKAEVMNGTLILIIPFAGLSC